MLLPHHLCKTIYGDSSGHFFFFFFFFFFSFQICILIFSILNAHQNRKLMGPLLLQIKYTSTRIGLTLSLFSKILIKIRYKGLNDGKGSFDDVDIKMIGLLIIFCRGRLYLDTLTTCNSGMFFLLFFMLMV